MKRITVLGNFSGRNAGDAAILGCLLNDISSRYTDVEFHVPTINTNYVTLAYNKYNVKPVGLMPWNLSVKIYGLPIYRAAMKADLILVTDAILFDRKLYNPLFNYLWTLSKVIPKAKKKGIPTILYNSSLGPIRLKAGKKSLKRITDNADVLILRDKDSIELLKKLGISHKVVHEGADCALNAQPALDIRFKEIRKTEKLFGSDRPVIGFNVNSYIDAFVRENGNKFGRDHLIGIYAETVDRIIEYLGVDVIFVETQHMDMAITNRVINKIKNQNQIRVVSNKKYSYKDICAVLKRLELFAGMRTHSLILSSAMGIPPVGIMTYPKNLGYMRTIGLENNLIEFRNLTADNYTQLIIRAFENRKKFKSEMMPRVEREKEKARAAAKTLAPYLS